VCLASLQKLAATITLCRLEKRREFETWCSFLLSRFPLWTRALEKA
jgi:hypothetical protein